PPVIANNIPAPIARFVPNIVLNGIPTGFLPQVDEGLALTFTQAQQGIGFDAMVEHQKQVMNVINSNKWVNTSVSFITGGNSGIIFFRVKNLHPVWYKPSTWSQHRPSIQQIIAEMRPQIAQIPGILAFIQVPPPIRVGGQFTKGQFQ